MRCSFFILALITFQLNLFALENNTVSLEPIVVDRQDASSLLEDINFYEEFEGFVLDSPEDILEYFSAVDLKKRADFGIQQDVSIRGSNFEENNILINGIEVNDPQTGHFSLEIPFTSADLEGVRLDKNRHTIEFTVKKPQKKTGLLLENYFGEHAFFSELLSINFPLKNIGNRVSFEHKNSSGGRKDTDFDIYNMSFSSFFEDGHKELELLYAYHKKDFGADGFYAAPTYTQEEEHTTQQFLILRSLLRQDYFDFECKPFFRRHTDKFILDRTDPSFYTNFHTTYIYGLDTRLDFKNMGFFLDSGLRKEKITSTNLGNNTRIRRSVSLGLAPYKINSFLLTGYARGDYYSQWDWTESFNLKLAYVLQDNISLHFSFDRFFRVPSFTELFYSSPSNIGNPNLDIQRMYNFEWALNFSKDNFKAHCALFLRRQKDTIDWVRNSSADPWRARNVGSIKTDGIELDFDFFFKGGLRKINLGYTFLRLDEKSPFNHSKYVFNYLKHRLLISSTLYLNNALSVTPVVIFENPTDDRPRTISHLNISYTLNNYLSFFLEGKNIFNEEYEEIDFVKADGRWYKIGMKLQF